jgi:hypothetical protein
VAQGINTSGSEWVRLFQQIGIGQWFRYFTGVAPVSQMAEGQM